LEQVQEPMSGGTFLPTRTLVLELELESEQGLLQSHPHTDSTLIQTRTIWIPEEARQPVETSHLHTVGTSQVQTLEEVHHLELEALLQILQTSLTTDGRILIRILIPTQEVLHPMSHHVHPLELRPAAAVAATATVGLQAKVGAGEVGVEALHPHRLQVEVDEEAVAVVVAVVVEVVDAKVNKQEGGVGDWADTSKKWNLFFL
jgi:hypothetical protein